jgi:hypothetical protein
MRGRDQSRPYEVGAAVRSGVIYRSPHRPLSGTVSIPLCGPWNFAQLVSVL